MTVYQAPGRPGSPVSYPSRYDNWIGGSWAPPVGGGYFENISPVTGEPFIEVARSTSADIELALDAAHAAAPTWARTAPDQRAAILHRVADRMERHRAELAVAEVWDNGKPVREALDADIPGAIDHLRYFAGAIRAQRGSVAQLDGNTVTYHFPEPLGVVGMFIPDSFPLLMAVWKLAPALAAGNAVVLKPAEQTPASIMYLMDLVADLIPPGVLNVVNGFGVEAGKPLAASGRVAKVTFTGAAATGRLIMQYASQQVVPVTLELGGRCANIFFGDVAAQPDEFYDKALEGFTMFAVNQGEMCTCPSRVLIDSSIYDSFLGDALERTRSIIQGNPLDTDTMIGAQVSNDQLDKSLASIDLAVAEGAKLLLGGERLDLGGELTGGYYVAPAVFAAASSMRISREERFGPVAAVTGFAEFDDAVDIANATRGGLDAGVWARDMSTAYRAGRAIRAGRVWTNCCPAETTHAPFGGHPHSGSGAETALTTLEQYQQTKNLLVSYAPDAVGRF